MATHILPYVADTGGNYTSHQSIHADQLDHLVMSGTEHVSMAERGGLGA